MPDQPHILASLSATNAPLVFVSVQMPYSSMEVAVNAAKQHFVQNVQSSGDLQFDVFKSAESECAFVEVRDSDAPFRVIGLYKIVAAQWANP